MSDCAAIRPAAFNWSGGKDSALGLHKVLHGREYEVRCLMTTINEEFRRVSQHGVREVLLDMQAASIGMNIRKVVIPNVPTMTTYDDVMEQHLEDLKAQGVIDYIFGDIYLEDLREYREEKLAQLDLKGVFPLWMNDPLDLVSEFIEGGFKAVVVCVDDRFLDREFVGREFDHRFINDLPAGVDPCGENGEFHTFVYDGPIYDEPILFERGEVVHKGARLEVAAARDSDRHAGAAGPIENFGFWYCDLLPKYEAPGP